ncbi:DUF397 domain-containing protein [Actinomadura scrupuli]|uniref:DUF397 domain-containing protein n=1 Tax=Actinomadura scrupuli TaxID=559629 RepID=UPI003D95301D
MTPRDDIHWRKSSRSGGVEDDACVEVARLGSGIGVRDSKHPAAGHLALTPTVFAGLLAQAKQGTFDR